MPTLVPILLTSCLLGIEPYSSVQIGAAKTQASKKEKVLYNYLSRSLSASARYLDHGVISVSSGFGYPHVYRISALVGVVDHLSVGASAHWLANQSILAWTPEVALAFFRLPKFEIGASYHQSLYPPPKVDDDPKTPAFQEKGHNFLGAVTFSSGLFSLGIDAGVVYRRISVRNNPKASEALFELALQPAGGLHLRVGNRRWGILLQGHLPDRMAEIVLDIRFSAFEIRKPGQWRL